MSEDQLQTDPAEPVRRFVITELHNSPNHPVSPPLNNVNWCIGQMYWSLAWFGFPTSTHHPRCLLVFRYHGNSSPSLSYSLIFPSSPPSACPTDKWCINSSFQHPTQYATHWVQFQEYTIQGDRSKYGKKYEAQWLSQYFNETSNLVLQYTSIWYCA